ncbi:MAG: hypothetical protein V1787_00415 [Candidatus Micrarchaeota archaeon]
MGERIVRHPDAEGRILIDSGGEVRGRIRYSSRIGQRITKIRMHGLNHFILPSSEGGVRILNRLLGKIIRTGLRGRSGVFQNPLGGEPLLVHDGRVLGRIIASGNPREGLMAVQTGARMHVVGPIPTETARAIAAAIRKG